MVMINDELRQRSLCDWTYEADYDENRNPACVQKVSSCINTVHHWSGNQCEKVKVTYPVRRKSGSVWLDGWMDLPVACLLATSVEHHQPYLSDARLSYPIAH